MGALLKHHLKNGENNSLQGTGEKKSTSDISTLDLINKYPTKNFSLGDNYYIVTDNLLA